MKLALHWKILIGMVAGLLVGIIAATLDHFGVLLPAEGQQGWIAGTWGGVVVDWIKPFGQIFINVLKAIAVPLIVASLIKGISDLRGLSSLSAMGGRTIALYLATTVVAASLGLVVVNLFGPGRGITEETRAKLTAETMTAVEARIKTAEMVKEQGPLQMLVDMFPSNIVEAMAEADMLKIILFTIFFAVGMILVPEEKSSPVKAFFDGLNEVILKLIDLIMITAPFGVFALLAPLVVEAPSWDLLSALVKYCLCVVAGLSLMIGFYTLLVRSFAGKGPGFFFRGISPAQLLAFSTSSSAATLPVTMERVEEHLGVDEEVASFVLPIGATVNMDGTSL